MLALAFTLWTTLTVAAFVVTVNFFAQREREWREREREWREREWKLFNELLRYAHVPALEVQQERVAKIPDAETAPLMNDIDLAMHLDEVLEEMQHRFAVATDTNDPIFAQTAYPAQWAEASRIVRERNAPIRLN